MWSWAKALYAVVSFFREVVEFIEKQKAIAQGRRDQELAARRDEDERVSNAASARDHVVTDGLQPVDVKNKDPYDRDNWN